MRFTFRAIAGVVAIICMLLAAYTNFKLGRDLGREEAVAEIVARGSYTQRLWVVVPGFDSKGQPVRIVVSRFPSEFTGQYQMIVYTSPAR